MCFSVSSFPPHLFCFWVKLIYEKKEKKSGECSSSLLQNRITQWRWGKQWALNLFLIGCGRGSHWENRCYFHSLCCRLPGKTTTPKNQQWVFFFPQKSNFKGPGSLVQVPWGHGVDNWFWQERQRFFFLTYLGTFLSILTTGSSSSRLPLYYRNIRFHTPRYQIERLAILHQRYLSELTGFPSAPLSPVSPWGEIKKIYIQIKKKIIEHQNVRNDQKRRAAPFANRLFKGWDIPQASLSNDETPADWQSHGTVWGRFKISALLWLHSSKVYYRLHCASHWVPLAGHRGRLLLFPFFFHATHF